MAKFHNPGIAGILGIPGVRAVSQFLRCFNVHACVLCLAFTQIQHIALALMNRRGVFEHLCVFGMRAVGGRGPQLGVR